MEALRYQGKMWGAPMESQVGFYYNKALFEQAGVDAAAIKTWPDLLDAVKKLKAAGITPIIVGGADKWPMHFYWTYLAMRRAASPPSRPRSAARAAASPTRSSSRPARSSSSWSTCSRSSPASWARTARVGQFADGKGAMSCGQLPLQLQRGNAADKKGLADDAMGWFAFPAVAGGKGEPPTRWAASTAGW